MVAGLSYDCLKAGGAKSRSIRPEVAGHGSGRTMRFPARHRDRASAMMGKVAKFDLRPLVSYGFTSDPRWQSWAKETTKACVHLSTSVGDMGTYSMSICRACRTWSGC